MEIPCTLKHFSVLRHRTTTGCQALNKNAVNSDFSPYPPVSIDRKHLHLHLTEREHGMPRGPGICGQGVFSLGHSPFISGLVQCF